MLQGGDLKRPFHITVSVQRKVQCVLCDVPGSFPEIAAVVLGSFGADFGVVPGLFQELIDALHFCVGSRLGSRSFGVILKVLVCHGFRLALEILMQQVGSMCFPRFLAWFLCVF